MEEDIFRSLCHADLVFIVSFSFRFSYNLYLSIQSAMMQCSGLTNLGLSCLNAVNNGEFCHLHGAATAARHRQSNDNTTLETFSPSGSLLSSPTAPMPFTPRLVSQTHASQADIFVTRDGFSSAGID